MHFIKFSKALKHFARKFSKQLYFMVIINCFLMNKLSVDSVLRNPVHTWSYLR